MAKTELSKNQHLFLQFFASKEQLFSAFYFTGGTCLTEFYLHHRYSEDLDFFSERQFNVSDITLFLNSHKKKLQIAKIDYQQSFNRNIYQLLYEKKGILKVEFTYYPFNRIETKKSMMKTIQIDSLIDIAVNKLFTIYQNPRGRDYFDLYLITIKDPKITIKRCISLARAKFDFPIDLLQLGSQFMKAQSLFDDPILKVKTKKKNIEHFFLKEAMNLKSKLLSDSV